MLKIEYFNFRLLLGVLRSKQVSGRRRHHSVYSVNVRGSFKLSTGERTVLPPGSVMPQVTLWRGKKLNPLIIELLCYISGTYSKRQWKCGASGPVRPVHEGASFTAPVQNQPIESMTEPRHRRNECSLCMDRDCGMIQNGAQCSGCDAVRILHRIRFRVSSQKK